jgi:crossover junction endodeoxyribonuclease RusA
MPHLQAGFVLVEAASHVQELRRSRGVMIAFTVLGKPEPQGSSRAFIPKGWNRAVITSDNSRLKPWRQQVSGAALEAAKGLDLPVFRAHKPLGIRLRFYFQRPKSVTAKTRPGMTTKPDGDKILRAVLDALTGIIAVDDAQFVDFSLSKHYGVPRVEVEVYEAVLVEESARSLFTENPAEALA